MDDFVLQTRQIAQYPLLTAVRPTDVLLVQQDGLGGPYMSVTGLTLLNTALEQGGFLKLAPGSGLAWNGASLTWNAGRFLFTEDVHVPTLHSDGDIFVAGQALAKQQWVTGLFDALVQNTVWSVNGRTGRVMLQASDILQAGAAPINAPHFSGHVTAPTPWNVYASDDTVATVRWVQNWACQSGLVVSSYNGRGGAVTPIADDVTVALSAPGVYAYANTAPMGDASKKLATTLFVDNAVEDLRGWTDLLFETKEEAAALNYAPINSPAFTGIPTAPTANPGTTTGQIATTAFVQAAVTASTTGVSSFNTRTGAVVLNSSDVYSTGAFTDTALAGTPHATTAAPGTNTTQLATCAFVQAAITAATAGVTSFNTRTGAVVLTLADVTAVGGAPVTSPTFTGVPVAPTAAPGANNNQLATTAFVSAAITAIGTGVVSFNGRTGVVSLIGADVSAAGGALVASPIFTGTPTAPTAAPGTANTQLATTAFVMAAIAALGGVTSFNTRSGAVTLTLADVTGVGGAPIASPAFTGVPAAPTATAGTNSTQLATTAFVQAALSAAPGGVSSFNTRTGAITLLGADISAAGGALTASPSFTGAPLAPTAAPGTNTQQLATCAFVATAIASSGGVSTFNGRAGAVTLNATDVFNASGALYTQADAAPALATNNTFWFDSIAGQLYVRYSDPVTSAKNWVIANAPQPAAAAAGSRVLLSTTVIAAAVTSVDFFQGFDGTYDELELVSFDVLPASDAQAMMRVSTDGSTFDATAQYEYAFSTTSALSGAAGAAGAVNVTSALMPTLSAIAINQNYFVQRIRLSPVARSGGYVNGTMRNAGNATSAAYGAWGYLPTTVLPIKGLRFMVAGTLNMTRGTFKLYGIVK